MDKKQQFTKRRKRFYVPVGVTFLIAGLLLYVVGLGHRNPVLQGLGLTIPMAYVVWVMSFFQKEPPFPWRREAVTAVGLAGLLIGYLFSILALNYHSGDLVAMVPLICIAPTFLFRIIEMWKTARDKEQ